MTIDMIAMASNWEEKLHNTKCDKEDDPHLGYMIRQPANSIRER